MSENCPICGRGITAKPKSLYGYPVCSKCFYGFAARRQFAFILDFLFMRILAFAAGFAAGYLIRVLGIMSGMSERENEIGGSVVGFVVLFFFLLKDGFSGASLGKRLTGLEVLDRGTGRPAGFLASFKRNLPGIIPLMPIILGVSLYKGRRLGEGWADTKVVIKKYKDRLPFSTMQEGGLPPGREGGFLIVFLAVVILGLVAAIAVPAFQRMTSPPPSPGAPPEAP